MPPDFPRSVLVLHETISADARADEVDTLVQANYVADVMRDLGWSVTTLATDLELSSTLAAISAAGPECVFNLVE